MLIVSHWHEARNILQKINQKLTEKITWNCEITYTWYVFFCHARHHNPECSSFCLCFGQVFLGLWPRRRSWTVYFNSTWSSASTSRTKLSRTDWMTAGSIRAVGEFTTWASIHLKCRSQPRNSIVWLLSVVLIVVFIFKCHPSVCKKVNVMACFFLRYS